MRLFKTGPALGILLGFFLVPFMWAEEPDTPLNLIPDAPALADEISDDMASYGDSSENPAEDPEEDDPEVPDITVVYNTRNETDYVEIRTAEKIEEYHYLSHIKYSDLIFVLSDLLRRITQDGFQWSTLPAISYEKNEEVALLYRKDLVNDRVYGIVQFPDFRVWISGARKQDLAHRFNAGSGRDMMTLVFSFAQCLAQAEQTLGINQLEYTMKFFKPETP
jgi:hypothetical protein